MIESSKERQQSGRTADIRLLRPETDEGDLDIAIVLALSKPEILTPKIASAIEMAADKSARPRRKLTLRQYIGLLVR